MAWEGQHSSREGLCPFFQEKCRNADATGRTLTQFFDERMVALEGAVSAAALALKEAESKLMALALGSQSPRTLHAVALAGAAKREGLEGQIAAQCCESADCAAAIATLDSSLLPCANLDAEMTKCSAIMAENLADSDTHRLYYRLRPHADSESASPQISESEHAKANTTKESLHRNRTKLRRVGEKLVENPMVIQAGWFEAGTAPKKESFSP